MSDLIEAPRHDMSKAFIPYGSMGPAANRTSFKKINREVHELIATNCPAIIEKAIKMVLATDDIRAVIVWATKVLEHVQGRPTDRPQSFDEMGGAVDPAFFSDEEMAKIVAAAEFLRWALQAQAERRAGIETAAP
jgi:hypothetical protein